MRRVRYRRSWLALGLLAAVAATAGAVILGQIDDFEDGTTQGWIVGLPHPDPPQNIPSGGPGGDDDNHMLLTAIGGDGPGSRLSTFNLDQWAGDYLAAGITSIEIDFNNFSDSDLLMRLVIADPMGGGPPANAVLTDAVFLPAGSGWVSTSFSISPEDLFVLLGDANTALMQATELRILHNEDPTFPPPPVVARLGVDNIEAVGGPTPTQHSTWGRIRNTYR